MKFNSIELFAGAGGLALGLEKAGLNAVLLNEIDKSSCETLKYNRPNWNVVHGDIKDLDFKPYKDVVDFISGGFPCQSFSYAGNKLGFDDARGTMFFEFARAIKEVQPKVFLGENVKGMLNHDKGRTIETIKSIISDLGYTLVECSVFKAIQHKVPQKRERLILIGVRNDLIEKVKFIPPKPNNRIFTMTDALKAGDLYASDVPKSDGQVYNNKKEAILKLVPPGGCWRHLPDKIQREYMKKSYFLGGGKTGMARRLSWDEPSLTLTCSPAQNQTERCHPDETRPLTVKEYARIQTFPDNWTISGGTSSQYKQIGNAVPVNFAHEIGKSIINLLKSLN